MVTKAETVVVMLGTALYAVRAKLSDRPIHPPGAGRRE